MKGCREQRLAVSDLPFCGLSQLVKSMNQPDEVSVPGVCFEDACYITVRQRSRVSRGYIIQERAVVTGIIFPDILLRKSIIIKNTSIRHVGII